MIDFRSSKMGDDVLVVQLAGRLDTETCDYFFSCLADEIERGHVRVIVDCRDLEYVSSLGLGMFVRAHSRMKKHGGNVKLARVESGILEIFRIVRFDKLLQIYPTVREAYQSFQEP